MLTLELKYGMQLSKRAVSEVIASIIIITIAVAVGTGLYVYSLTYFSTIKSSAELDFSAAISREREKFNLLNYYYDDSTNTLHLYIYNYGEVETKIVNVYIDENQVYGGEILIKSSELREVSFKVTLSTGIHSIAIISERGNRYEGFIEI